MVEYVEYIELLSPQSVDPQHPDHIESLKRDGILFDNLNGLKRPQLIDLLHQYVMGELPMDTKLKPKQMFLCVPNIILENLPNDQQSSLYGISHMFKDRFSRTGAHWVAYSLPHSCGIWVPGKTRTIKKKGQEIGKWTKFSLTEYDDLSGWTKRERKEIKMEVYSLPENQYPMPLNEMDTHKFGNWKLCKLYKRKRRNRWGLF